MTFDEAFEKLLGHEGGYSNHLADKGGETMWGVTEAVARTAGYRGSMIDLPQSLAKQIYRNSYWLPCKCDELPPDVRYDVFDGAVNSGVAQSSKWLQRSIQILDDGVIGPMTVKAASRFPGSVIKARYIGRRLQFMTGLPNWGSFGKGWANRIAKNLMET